MPTITILTDWDSDVEYNQDTGEYTKDPTLMTLRVGYSKPSKYRFAIRFPLTDLPLGVTVTKVELLLNKSSARGETEAHNIHAYCSAGQEDPEPDPASTFYVRIATGNLYVHATTIYRDSPATPYGEFIVVDLGPQACIDVENAKVAVNRFSVSMREDGDNDPVQSFRSKEFQEEYTVEVMPRLRITYAVGYQYSDGLVCISVAG